MQKKVVASILSIALFLGAAFASPSTKGETPQQGLKAIIELYKAKDWEGLVKERCLDVRHAHSEEEIQSLVSQVSAQFSQDNSLAALVTSYEAALSQEPRIESEGTVAIFASDVGSVRLSKKEDGAWGLRF